MGVLGQVARQRPVGSPHAQEADGQPGERAVGGRLVVGQLGAGEGRRRRLPDADRLLRGTLGFAEARTLRVGGVEAPERDVEVEAPRKLGEPLQPGQSAGRLPTVSGHRATSPRCWVRITVSTNELIDTYRAMNRASTSPST